ncbi:MAG: SGNH/GDSL hydrolase family protein [Chloroflexota bacterium]|nr:SGNH/GDSL hydrolase family protein [Chloroflexota bacterium]
MRALPRLTPRWSAWWARLSFIAVTLLTATIMLAFLDWLLFDTTLVAPRLPLKDEVSPTGKLLLADRHRDTEVLYLGDSRVQYGIDPRVVSDECACGPGFNAAFAAADPRLTRIMADRLLAKLSPRLVVIGVSQWELSDSADIHVWGPAPELVAPWRWPEFGVTIDGPAAAREVLGDAWRTYKYRAALRVALDPWSPDAGETDRQRGFDVYRSRRRVGEQDLAERHGQWFTNYSLRGRRAEALRGLVADLRRRGIDILLVAPPLYPGFQGRVRHEVEMFHMTISELASEHGAVFADLTEPSRSGLTGDDFLDVVHLTEEGTTEFSRQVAREIRSHFGSRPADATLRGPR